jgi:hypothetical protein
VKTLKRLELYLLTIAVLLGIIASLLAYDIVINPMIKSYQINRQKKQEMKERTYDVLEEISRIIFAIKGYYYLNRSLPDPNEILNDTEHTYNYSIDFEEMDAAYRISIRGNFPLLTNQKYLDEFRLEGKLYSTENSFLYVVYLDKFM